MIESKVVNVEAEDGVTVVTPCNIYGCKLGKDVFVGPFCEIQADVVIGDASRIQSHTFICSFVTIGESCFIGHGVMFINDVFKHGGPARGDKTLWRSTHLGDRVSIGSNATIMPIKICSDVVIGAGSVVTNDIELPGIYAGNPARFVRGLELHKDKGSLK